MLTLDYPNSTHNENNEVKVKKGPRGHICAHASASRMLSPCVWALKFVLFDNTQASTMATDTSRKDMRIISLLFQLSEHFTYPNDNDFGDGQRGSDNRGWTVLVSIVQWLNT